MCIHGTHGHIPEQLKPSLRMLQHSLPATTGRLIAPAEQICSLGQRYLKEKPIHSLKVLQQRVPLVIKGQTTEQFSHQCMRSPEQEGQLWRLQVTLGGTKYLRPWPGIGAKHTEWKGKFSPARGHHRPWRHEHRKEPAFNRGCHIKIPAPLFPVSKMSDAVLLSPLHASWPFLFQQRGNSTHPTIKIILGLALPSSTPQKSCDTAEPDHNQHLKSLGSACIYGGGRRQISSHSK